MKTNGSSEPGICANLVADMGPDELPAECIILSAHLDSFWNAPGAFDNLTGVATVYEIGRLLSPFRKHFRRRLRVIAFTAEELGFQGSKAYVARHAEELDDVRLVVNLDSLFPATARGMAVMWSPVMRDYINNAFTGARQLVDVRNLYCCSSDYLPFMLEGVPACRPADWEDSFPAGSHTHADDLANVRPDWIQLNAIVYAHLLARLLTDPNPLPARKLSPDEVSEQVRKNDAVEGVGWMGFNIKEMICRQE
ncbi:MAG: M28 family peptidase [Spirochaetales bacterium]|nr:M28 family peptidase [Spirochaetales bacterium]